MDDATFTSSHSLAMIVFYLLLILSAILGVIYYYIETSRISKMGQLIPGPPTVPFLGNGLVVFNVEPAQLIDKLREFVFYGKVVRAFLGPLLYVFIIDPKDVEIILSSHVHIDKSFEYRYFKPWLGEGLLISTGEKWRSHRKIIAPTFHLSILRTFVPLFYENSKVLVSKMREVIGKEFDCHDYLSATTVDILLETAMGVKDTKTDGAGFEYAMAVMKMCDIVHRRTYALFTRFDFFFNLTKSAKLQEKLLGIIHGLTNSVIKEKKNRHVAMASQDKMQIKSVNSCQENNEPKEVVEKNSSEEKARYNYVRDDLDDIDENDIGEKKRLAFLDLMIELARNGVNLTDEEIKEEVDTIMFEGHDTTAAGSSFVLCLLGYYPDVQEKVYQELDEIFQGSDRETTFRDTLEMKYLERVILETLRLFPPVPLIARKLNEDVKLVTGGYVIPEGATVLIPPYQVHRQEEIYPNPEEFNPDNFLPENMQQRHYYSYIPFSAGPRSCVGRKYAMLKLKVLLSTILRHYKILSNVPPKQFRLVGDIILKRSDGFKIRIEPRDARVRPESHFNH
ncbi:cytochrome P450 4g15-like [Diprion similis]|uniref:cytochrome P450 4g15-like n=1 Tax=Diprion similis TaxID=362088 RepID=UPI001EF7A96D|nr:cytochrome P450 4g15-like [Diprion similis]